MSGIAAILAAAVIVIVLIMLSSIAVMNIAMRQYVGKKHHALEMLSNEQSVPSSWSRKYEAQLRSAKERGESTDRLEQIKLARRMDYTKRIRKLETYVQKTKLVQDEETRTILLDDLRQARMKWEME